MAFRCPYKIENDDDNDNAHAFGGSCGYGLIGYHQGSPRSSHVERS